MAPSEELDDDDEGAQLWQRSVDGANGEPRQDRGAFLPAVRMTGPVGPTEPSTPGTVDTDVSRPTQTHERDRAKLTPSHQRATARGIEEDGRR